MDNRNFTFKASSSVNEAFAGHTQIIPVKLDSLPEGVSLKSGMGIIYKNGLKAVIKDILTSESGTVIEISPIQNTEQYKLIHVLEDEELTARRDLHVDLHWEGVDPEDRF